MTAWAFERSDPSKRAVEPDPSSVLVDLPAEAGEMVLLTEKCTGDRATCAGRVCYSELTDNLNTHWHIKPGAALVPVAAAVADQSQLVTRVQVPLTFEDLRRANAERCARWHPGFPADETWTGADWSNALGGEAGELAEAALAIVAYAGKVQNTVKKLRRYETGTNTAVDKPLAALLAELDAEMADVACYLDLLATKYGRDLAGAIVAKFNAVSERQGFPERLPLGGRR